MESGLLRGVAILRVVAITLVVIVLAVDRTSLVRPLLAWLLVGAAILVTVLTSHRSVRRPLSLLAPTMVTTELVLDVALLALDGVVFAHGHVGSTQGGLAGSWPIAGVLTAGIAFGPWIGLASGAAMGVAHFAAAPLNGVPIGSLSTTHLLGFVSSFVLYAIAGAAAGYAVRRVRAYDHTVAVARAREEISRTLHDGVLQTLAVVTRRSDDPELVALAQVQERELRSFLTGAPSVLSPRAHRGGSRRDVGDLSVSLQETVARRLPEPRSPAASRSRTTSEHSTSGASMRWWVRSQKP